MRWPQGWAAGGGKSSLPREWTGDVEKAKGPAETGPCTHIANFSPRFSLAALASQPQLMAKA
jgi:hypothetical protein